MVTQVVAKVQLQKKVAEYLNYSYLDSGAMYRSVTLYLYRNEIHYEELNKIVKALENINIVSSRLLAIGDENNPAIDEKAFVNNTAGGASNITDGIYIDGLNYVTGSGDAFSNMTIECWCKSKSSSSGNTYDHRIILSYDRSAVFRFSIGFDGASAAAGKPSLQWMNNNNILDNYADTYSGDLRDDQWHQVGVTFTTSAVKYYVDGVNVDTHTGSWSPLSNHAESETPRYGWIGNGSEATTAGGQINPPGLFYGSIANLK